MYYGEKAGITIPAPRPNRIFREITTSLIGRLKSKTAATKTPEKERGIETPEMQPFYLYGRLIAVLEQGARSHDDIQCLELYYPIGFMPCTGLTVPLQKHRYSVLPFLERQRRDGHYLDRLNALATALEQSDTSTFDSWCSRYLNYDEDYKPKLPDRSTPKAAPLYAQGYLDERQELQPNRPALPPEKDLSQFCWDYHQGRLLTWNIAGNHPDLPAGVQLGIADRRALTSPTEHASKRRE